MERFRTFRTINLFCRVLVITLPLLVALAFIQMKIHDLIFDLKEQSLSRQISTNEKKDTAIEKVDPKNSIDPSTIKYLPDGTIHLEFSEYISKSLKTLKSRSELKMQIKIYDSNFNLIWEGNSDSNNIYSGRYLSFGNSIPTYELNNDIYRFSSVYPYVTQSLVIPAKEDIVKNGYWKYNHFTHCFEEFDENKNIIGYCGSEGFVSDKSQIKRFGELFFITSGCLDTNNEGPHVLLGTRHEMYEMNFGTHTIQSIIKLPEKQIKKVWIYDWGNFFPKESPSVESIKYRPLIMCQTQDDSLFFILRDPDEIIQTRLLDEFKTKNISFIATYENIYIRVRDLGLNPPEEIAKDYRAYSEWLDYRNENPIKYSDHLYTVDASGTIKLLNGLEWTKPARVTSSNSSGYSLPYPNKKILRTIAISSPVFYDLFNNLFIMFIGNPFLNNLESHMVDMAITEILDISSPFHNPYCYFISALIAGIVFIHARPRRKSRAGLIGWVVFAFLFNVVGLLVYLATNFTPTIKCHKCNKKRGLKTSKCPHCNAELSIVNTDRICIITEN
jgi:hypothetical protein